MQVITGISGTVSWYGTQAQKQPNNNLMQLHCYLGTTSKKQPYNNPMPLHCYLGTALLKLLKAQQDEHHRMQLDGFGHPFGRRRRCPLTGSLQARPCSQLPHIKPPPGRVLAV